jgi:hypothetical protein
LASFGLYEGRAPVNDYQAQAALIRDLATDTTKREMFARLHENLSRLADEVEQTMKTSKGSA